MSLFSTELPIRQWKQLSAAGFDQPVSGVVYEGSNPPCCGVPLGGISTGCLDIDPRGVYGYSSIFNEKAPRYEFSYTPRKAPNFEPILGLSIKGEGDDSNTWVLATKELIDGSEVTSCGNPSQVWGGGHKKDLVQCLKLEDVKPAKQVRYWGHYPVADIEFETEAPVAVSMRAWSPLLPGDTIVSNIPAATFEVHLNNTSQADQDGTIAFNFPGPDAQEAGSTQFTRTAVEESLRGVFVSGSKVQYVLGVLGDDQARFGAGLNKRAKDWSQIATKLPCPSYREDRGHLIYEEGSSSAAVDFHLAAGEQKIVRFLLAWYAPAWEGGHRQHAETPIHETTEIPVADVPEEQLMGLNENGWIGSQWDGDTHFYTQMYAARYDSALQVARRMAEEHASLLRRVLAWQEVVYNDKDLPVWLRDSLVNNLALIAEDSHWAQAKPPLGDWCFPEGAFGLLESPRTCPQMCCIPCDWYGNLPIVYFYPELARSSLKIFKQYQLESGEVPFSIGHAGDLPDFASPSYYWQVSANGPFYLMLIDRLWQRMGNNEVLQEFYESAKRCNTFTMGLAQGPEGVISMADIGGMEPFEIGEWAGMASHLGGIRLASLRIMQRMAQVMGDEEYISQCKEWYEGGSKAMEQEMWADSYYLNFYDKKTNKKSDDIMGYQLDGQWAAWAHGVGEVFEKDRIDATLQTIKRCNIALTPKIGAANFTQADGSVMPADAKVAECGVYTMVPCEVIILAMTYIYAGQKEFGLELAQKQWANIVLEQGHPWDLPGMVAGDSGKRIIGADYVMNMMLWALPAALQNQDCADPSVVEGLVGRMIQAAQEIK